LDAFLSVLRGGNEPSPTKSPFPQEEPFIVFIDEDLSGSLLTDEVNAPHFLAQMNVDFFTFMAFIRVCAQIQMLMTS
jgi:hypothetical protein